MDYPCLEIIMNEQSMITFSNLDFGTTPVATFAQNFRSLGRDGKIATLHKNGFIKNEHITMFRTEKINIILHFSADYGEMFQL